LNDNPSDIFLWNTFKNGDREAFDNLFRRYYPLLILYGSKICPDRDLVDDCIQDLFIELWQSRSTTEIQSVKAYFLKALKYKLFRRLKGIRSTQYTDTIEENTFEISHDHFIITREDELQAARTIINAINQLPGRQKEIVYLRIYQELSYEEISEVMNINYQVARNLFYQSIKSLRQVLSAKF
jgi:RNA polymerase sigma factor (sigma-70 family)